MPGQQPPPDSNGRPDSTAPGPHRARTPTAARTPPPPGPHRRPDPTAARKQPLPRSPPPTPYCPADRRYLATASGANTAMITNDHTTAPQM